MVSGCKQVSEGELCVQESLHGPPWQEFAGWVRFPMNTSVAAACSKLLGEKIEEGMLPAQYL
jgi:hypothetical protein